MGHPALKSCTGRTHSAPALRLVVGGHSTAVAPSLPTELFVLGLVLAILQVFDGILTGVGMHLYGLEMEGNSLLRSLMITIGYVPALTLVKGSSILLISMLCKQAIHIRWLKPALYGVAALYVLGAVIPWTYILVSEVLA